MNRHIALQLLISFLLGTLALSQKKVADHVKGRHAVDEKVKEDSLEELKEKGGNLFKVGEEVLLLPEVESNLNFDQPKRFPSKKNIQKQKEARDGCFWGRLYIEHWPSPIQYMQAHFGLPAPEGDLKFVLAPDTHSCEEYQVGGGATEGELPVAVIALRGVCTFGNKARAAAKAGAALLVVVNTEAGLEHLPAPDAHDVALSVVSVPRDEGGVLLRHLDRALRPHHTAPGSVRGRAVPIMCGARSECRPPLVADQDYIRDLPIGGYLHVGGGPAAAAGFPFEYLLAAFGRGVDAGGAGGQEGEGGGGGGAPLPLVPVLAEESCRNTTEDGYVPPARLQGAAAVVERGECRFIQKVKMAVDAGAEMVIIANRDPTQGLTQLGVEPRWAGVNISVPVLAATHTFGNLFFAEGASALNPDAESIVMTLKVEPSSEISRIKWQELTDAVRGGADAWPLPAREAGERADALLAQANGSEEQVRVAVDAWHQVRAARGGQPGLDGDDLAGGEAGEDRRHQEEEEEEKEGQEDAPTAAATDGGGDDDDGAGGPPPSRGGGGGRTEL